MLTELALPLGGQPRRMAALALPARPAVVHRHVLVARTEPPAVEAEVGRQRPRRRVARDVVDDGRRRVERVHDAVRQPGGDRAIKREVEANADRVETARAACAAVRRREPRRRAHVPAAVAGVPEPPERRPDLFVSPSSRILSHNIKTQLQPHDIRKRLRATLS